MKDEHTEGNNYRRIEDLPLAIRVEELISRLEHKHTMSKEHNK